VPEIASFHPQLVHFVVALLIVGVAARVMSLIPLPGRITFVGAMAATLIFLGTIASVLAVRSGLEAHEAVEGIPGIRPVVSEHEEDGERTRNIFLVVSLVEIGVLAFATRKPAVARGLRVLSAVVGVVGVVFLFETAEHGGDIVYEHAGGPGLRTGDSSDVRRLLVAGLYNNAVLDRKAGNSEAAATRIDELQRMMPADTGVRILRIQSQVRDRKDPAAALAALDSLAVPPSNRRLYMQKTMLQAEALDLGGQRDSARALLTALKKEIPQAARRVDAMLEDMK
jgi:Predicted membrane protein